MDSNAIFVEGFKPKSHVMHNVASDQGLHCLLTDC